MCRCPHAHLQALDFSRDILSLMHGELKICAYPHHGYWEDVGSLKDYYAANIALAKDVSRHFSFSLVLLQLGAATAWLCYSWWGVVGDWWWGAGWASLPLVNLGCRGPMLLALPSYLVCTAVPLVVHHTLALYHI